MKDNVPGVPRLNQLLVPESLWPRLTAWLHLQSLEAVKLPPELFEEDELPTYVIHFADYLEILSRTGRITEAPADSRAQTPSNPTKKDNTS